MTTNGDHRGTPAVRPPIFVGGAGRSGTTLLRVMLDSHPNIACGPELKVTTAIAKLWLDCQTGYASALAALHLPPREVNSILADTLRSFMAPFQAASGKARIAEKTPGNVVWFGPLHQMFPDSPLVHVIRDGRDVVASLLRMDWTGPDGRPIAYTQDAGAAARYWVTSVRAGREVAAVDPRLRSRYVEIRYEELVADPGGQMRLLLDFVGEPWDDAVLRHQDFERDLAGESSADQVRKPVYSSAIGRWRRDLSEKGQEAVKAVAGELLVELGYADDLAW